MLGTLMRHWLADISDADRGERSRLAVKAATEELVPSIFDTNDGLSATLAAITRTGLLIPASAWGGLAYIISPLLERFNALAPFDAAREQEEGRT